MESCGCVAALFHLRGGVGNGRVRAAAAGGKHRGFPTGMSGSAGTWREEILRGEYRCDLSVRVEALPNASGFIPMGEGG